MPAEAPFLQAASELDSWRSRYRDIALTNGCFDLLHCGHVEYLMAANKKAHEMGLPLLVAINSDDSVRRLKGAGRPINTLVDRAKVLRALRCVDAVTYFDADTPLALVKIVKPHLLIKAMDYLTKEIVGSDIVKANGGEVWLAPYRQGVSTTELIEKGGASGDRS
jgi:D-beta-D-heptose 7-phosphate kinase/D-beta-D-heptose 1-phosphate adenosyltransferase